MICIILCPKIVKQKLEIMKPIEKVFLLLLIFTCYFCSAQIATNDKSSLPIDTKTNCSIRYYYFPNLEAYFDNLEMVYYFKLNNKWQTAEELPANYGGYSLYNKVKVTINDYDGDEPYTLLKTHKKLYPYNSKGRFTNQTASTD